MNTTNKNNKNQDVPTGVDTILLSEIKDKLNQVSGHVFAAFGFFYSNDPVKAREFVKKSEDVLDELKSIIDKLSNNPLFFNMSKEGRPTISVHFDNVTMSGDQFDKLTTFLVLLKNGFTQVPDVVVTGSVIDFDNNCPMEKFFKTMWNDSNNG